jgi:hypothetical protein
VNRDGWPCGCVPFGSVRVSGRTRTVGSWRFGLGWVCHDGIVGGHDARAEFVGLDLGKLGAE